MLQALPPPVVAIPPPHYSNAAINMGRINSTNTNGASCLSQASNKCKSSCKRFSPNVFTPNKCQECFRQKNAHSAEALAENRACRKICKCGFLFVAPIEVDFTNPAHRARRWQRRWFILYDDGDLTFALDENQDTIPQDVIDMHTVTEVTDAQNITGQDFSIVLRSPEKEYYVRGTSKEEIRWWYDVLVMYPRSARYTRQQRTQKSHNQKLRSRTLPSNTLSDDQLLALKAGHVPPDVTRLTDSTEALPRSTAVKAKESNRSLTTTISSAIWSVVGKPSTSNESMSSGATDGTNSESSGVSSDVSTSKLPQQEPKQTKTGLVRPPSHDVTASQQTASTTDGGTPSYLAPTSTRAKNTEGSSTSFTDAEPKTVKKETVLKVGSNGGSLLTTNSLVRSSTMDYLDQLKEKRFPVTAGTHNIGAPVSNNTDVTAASTLNRLNVQPEDKYYKPDKVIAEPNPKATANDAFGASTDSFTDTDLSTDSEEASPPTTAPASALTSADAQRSPRFVFGGLSHQDIEDLKQLQRIMSKKGSTGGSTSSRSSSTSSISAYGHHYPHSAQVPLTRETHLTAPLPMAKTVSEVDFHTRPRSPPLNRTAMSRVKERARVRSRSKSPVPRGDGAKGLQQRSNDQQRTLVIDGDIKYEENGHESKPGNVAGLKSSEIEGRLLNLRKQYQAELRKVPHTSRRDVSTQLDAKPLSISQVPRADQSTQISLDIRHYETMVSNLEKRLLDREQFLRETGQKLEYQKKDNMEKDKLLVSAREKLKESEDHRDELTDKLQRISSLNETCENRIQELADLRQRDNPKVYLDEIRKLKERIETSENQTKEMETQLADMNSSYTEMAGRKDSLIDGTRKELEVVKSKLAESEKLLLISVGKESDKILRNNIPTMEMGTAQDSESQQLSRKFLFALSEIKQLRQETSSLKDQLLLNEKQKTELSKSLQNERSHDECNCTIEALHKEISALQTRLTNQERRHGSEIGMLREKNDDMGRRLAEDLAMLGQLEMKPDQNGELKRMQDVYEKSMDALNLSHTRLVTDLKARHRQEMEAVLLRKDRELAEEARATKAAIEVITKAYQKNLKNEVEKVAQIYSQYHEEQHESSCVSVKEEIQDLANQLISKSTSTAELESTLREKETRLRNYHDHLSKISRQYCSSVSESTVSNRSAKGAAANRAFEFFPELNVAPPVRANHDADEQQDEDEEYYSPSEPASP